MSVPAVKLMADASRFALKEVRPGAFQWGESGGCHLHPEFRLPVGQPKPRSPQTVCPFCQEEAAAAADASHQPRGEVRELDPATAGQRMDDRYLMWLEQQPNQPGSFEQDAALARIAEARIEEEQREQRRKPSLGTLVSARVEGGLWIEYRRPPGSREIRRLVMS